MTEPTREARLAQIRERLEAQERNRGDHHTVPCCYWTSGDYEGEEHDAAFIAGAPADIEWLLAEVDRLQADHTAMHSAWKSEHSERVRLEKENVRLKLELRRGDPSAWIEEET